MEFVNYSIGKKLQEKGYPHGYNRFGYRPIYSDECTIRYLWDTGAYDEEYYGENIPCPTISEVLKWLREEKNIHITILIITDFSTDSDNNICEEWSFWSFYVTNLNDGSAIYDDCRRIDSIEYQSYEESAIAGIEYVLDNLI